MKSRRGQIALFLLFALVALVLLSLLNVDVFDSVRAKARLQDGGDAAAIAAAKCQGQLLNRIGRLNIDHVVAAVFDRTNECRRIEREQARLALLGPVVPVHGVGGALARANEAAKKNGMPVREEFATILRRHVREIRTVYSGGGGFDPYPEPFPGAWTEYATAIDNVVATGLAVGPDNIDFYDAPGGHPLACRAFYNAVAARDWCWFWFFRNGLLESYSGHGDWPPLSPSSANTCDNSEIFSLHVTASRCSILDVFTPDELLVLVEKFSDEPVTADDIDDSELVRDRGETWYFYGAGAWSRWFNGFSLADDPDGGEFPLAGEIKPEYNVRGCAAVCRCAKEVAAVAVDSVRDFTWSAAAKPMGTVENLAGETDAVTAFANLVVPCFTDVRLVPVDSVGGEDLSTADVAWVDHLRSHLAAYLERGPDRGSLCWYCRQLVTWENPTFRRTGSIWLKYNSGTCRRGDYGPGGRGGTSHGH
jgi:hypothetical protein